MFLYVCVSKSDWSRAEPRCGHVFAGAHRRLARIYEDTQGRHTCAPPQKAADPQSERAGRVDTIYQQAALAQRGKVSVGHVECAQANGKDRHREDYRVGSQSTKPPQIKLLDF